jgi:hypothetical protein
MGRFDGLKNMLGPLPPEVLARLEAFFANPCEKTWEDVHGLILTMKPRTRTFWQCVIAVDPTFPKRLSKTKRWPRVPDFFTARRALEFAKGASNLARSSQRTRA